MMIGDKNNDFDICACGDICADHDPETAACLFCGCEAFELDAAGTRLALAARTEHCG